MSLHENNFFSNTLNRNVVVNVILPEPMGSHGVLKAYSSGHNKLPVLWLLHGSGGDSTDWIRKSLIEEFATKYRIAVVMPQTELGFYTNMVHGPNYWTFLTEELPERMRFIFPLSEKKEDNFVMGNSMGGYGALRWAFAYPEKFAGVIGLSPATDLMDIAQEAKINDSMGFFNSFDITKIENTPVDLEFLLKRLDTANAHNLKVYVTSGTKDFLLEMDKKYDQQLRAKFEASNYTWKVGIGTHDWPLWNSLLPDIMEWIGKQIKH